MMSGWRIRKADDTVYGPVDWPEILQWASQGRIDPADALSANGHHWVPAPSLAELKLIWMVTLHDDTAAGPYHASTLLELLQSGSVHEDTPVYHAITQAPSTVHAVLKAAVLAGEIEVESAPSAESEGEVAHESTSPQASGEAAPDATAQDELAAARAEIGNLQSALQRAMVQGREGEAERQSLSKRLAQAQQEVAEVRQRLEQLAAAADKVAEQCDLLRGEREAARQEVARQSAALEEAARQQQQLQEEQQALRARYVALENAQQTAAATEREALRQAATAEHAAREQTLQREQERVAAQTAELAQRARQIEALQSELADLQRDREQERQEASRQIRALREAQAATEARLAAETEARQRAEQALERMPPPAAQPTRPLSRPSVPASGALASSDLYRLPARRPRESGGAEHAELRR